MAPTANTNTDDERRCRSRRGQVEGKALKSRGKRQLGTDVQLLFPAATSAFIVGAQCAQTFSSIYQAVGTLGPALISEFRFRLNLAIIYLLCTHSVGAPIPNSSGRVQHIGCIRDESNLPRHSLAPRNEATRFSHRLLSGKSVLIHTEYNPASLELGL
ncbi:uncharacterized protein BCR38DRAFT_127419 [Pseudomassariella vexata]|uniref:Uncharacterized protein n=1 Tax=Pseudomassariella vexata TaxID=1141098 RepID=A0A1Y2D732_9PEZI|nr:uncharacterized protein BCR38DRAFT_127419 [Pseudomassariella vexata]ORY55100.1 hypothetical protein BCR38DRAFT_127419 [Pseudomassariella vexata]